jgi:hypothetical protein
MGIQCSKTYSIFGPKAVLKRIEGSKIGWLFGGKEAKYRWEGE